MVCHRKKVLDQDSSPYLATCYVSNYDGLYTLWIHYIYIGITKYPSGNFCEYEIKSMV